MDKDNIIQPSISPNSENANFYQQLATNLKNDNNAKHSCSYFDTLQHQAGIQSTRKNGYYIKDNENKVSQDEVIQEENEEENEIDEIFSFGKDIHTTSASKTILNPIQHLEDEDFYNDVGEQEDYTNQNDNSQQISNKYPERGHIVETVDNNNAAIDIRGKLKSKENEQNAKSIHKEQFQQFVNAKTKQRKKISIKQKKRVLEFTISIIGVSSIVLLGGLVIYFWHINDKDINPLDDIVLEKKNTSQLPDSTPDVLDNNDTIELGTTEENLIGYSRTAENQSTKDKFTIFYDNDANISLMGDLELKISAKNNSSASSDDVKNGIQEEDFVASTNSLVISLYNGEEYGKITIDSVGIDAPINYGMSQTNIDKFDVCSSESFGIPGGEVPILIGGHNTNSFKTLQNVQIGDIISINTFYGVFNYEVYYVGIGKVVQNNTLATDYLKDINTGEELFFKNEDGEILNLYTCYDNPDDNQYPTPYRFAVKAKRVSGSVDTNYWDN